MANVPGRWWWPVALAVLVLLGGPTEAARAQGGPDGPREGESASSYADRLVALGDRYFWDGEYGRAAEVYRAATLERPEDGLLKLIHSHALFARGDYAYASYQIRRGLRFLGHPADLDVDVVRLFPTRNAYGRALQTLERYLRHYPDDPVGLTTLAYLSLFTGEDARARTAARRLLSRDTDDAFARWVLGRLPAGSSEPPAEPDPEPEEEPEPDPAPEAEGPPPEIETVRADAETTLKGGVPRFRLAE